MRANPARYANKQCLKDDFFDGLYISYQTTWKLTEMSK